MHLEPWGPDDLPLLEKTVGDPAMMTYLGGAETAEKMAERQAKYAAPDSGMFKIVDDSGDAIGSVGFWEREWRGETVHEVGWLVIPEFQGRGVAVEAMRQLIPRASSRPIHAFPNVENAASNAICGKLGFTLLGEHDFEYPPGHWMRCNDWRLNPAGAAADDWRLSGQERYLQSATLVRREWAPPPGHGRAWRLRSGTVLHVPDPDTPPPTDAIEEVEAPAWDHDHCVFCWAKFIEPERDPEALTVGYTVADERPSGRFWICPACFADFRERFAWINPAE